MALEALESDTPKMKEILYLRCGIAANETDSCKAITGEQPDTSRDGNEVLTKVLENGLLGSEIKLLINVAIVAHSNPPLEPLSRCSEVTRRVEKLPRNTAHEKARMI